MLLYDWISRTAQKHGTLRALFYRDTYLSFRGLLHRVERRASELASFGIKEGDSVGLMLGNVPEFFILLLALSKLKTTVIPMDPTLSVREVNTVLRMIPLKALITRPKGGTDPTTTVPPSVKPLRKNPPRIEPESQRRLQGTLLTCSLYKKSPSDRVLGVPLVFLTQDAQGRPKGVLRTEENILASYDVLHKELGFSEKDRLIGTLPLHTSYAFENLLLTSLGAGCVLYLEDESSVSRVLKIIKEQEITFFPTQPLIIDSIGKIPTLKPLSHQSIRVISSGAPLDSDIAQVFQRRFGPRVYSLYRTTETGPISIEKTGHFLGTVGCAMADVQISFNNQNVMVSSPTVSRDFLVYEDDAAFDDWMGATQSATLQSYKGPLDTGDLGQINSEGQLVLNGRSDEQVKIEGKRASLSEISKCLEKHPKVRKAQAVVIPDPDGVLQLIAKVSLRSSCSEEELLDHCIFNLSSHKIPRRIEFTKQMVEG